MNIYVEDIFRMKEAIDALMALNNRSTGEDIHHSKMVAIPAQVAIERILRKLESIQLEVTK